MEEWPIEPLAGIGPVRFGMSAADVSKAVSSDASEEDEGSIRFLDNALRVSVEGGQIVEISVAPEARKNVTYVGLPIFGADPFQLLSVLERDGSEMFEMVGYLMIPSLGIMLTGVHDGDRGQLAVTTTREPFDPFEIGEPRRVTAAGLMK